MQLASFGVRRAPLLIRKRVCGDVIYPEDPRAPWAPGGASLNGVVRWTGRRAQGTAAFATPPKPPFLLVLLLPALSLVSGAGSGYRGGENQEVQRKRLMASECVPSQSKLYTKVCLAHSFGARVNTSNQVARADVLGMTRMTQVGHN